MVNYQHYSYKLIWSAEDQEFVGLCAEFPSLSYLHEDRSTALEGITNLVKDVIVDMEKNGEKIPEPIATKTYSGKLQVRIPPSLHRRLAMEAAEENVSLNRYMSQKLAN
jgi:predicted HicB family RNase H-like nuclease